MCIIQSTKFITVCLHTSKSNETQYSKGFKLIKYYIRRIKILFKILLTNSYYFVKQNI
jgi:hypothetical protein